MRLRLLTVIVFFILSSIMVGLNLNERIIDRGSSGYLLVQGFPLYFFKRTCDFYPLKDGENPTEVTKNLSEYFRTPATYREGYGYTLNESNGEFVILAPIVNILFLVTASAICVFIIKITLKRFCGQRSG